MEFRKVVGPGESKETRIFGPGSWSPVLSRKVVDLFREPRRVLPERGEGQGLDPDPRLSRFLDGSNSRFSLSRVATPLPRPTPTPRTLTLCRRRGKNWIPGEGCVRKGWRRGSEPSTAAS